MSNAIYPNIVLENKYVSILTTLLNLSQFCTVKNIDKGAGDTLRIVKKSVSGAVDELAMGNGNTNVVETTASYADYVLKTTQGKGILYDEEIQKDGEAVDTMLKGIGEKMMNKWNADIIGEFGKAWSHEIAGSINFDNFVDAVAKFGEQTEAKFALVNPKGLATLRKALATNLSYSEAFVRTGYIGTVIGIPVYVSAAVPEGEVIIADATAVAVLLNKNQEAEQERDADHRKTEYYIRTVALAALLDATHVARIAAAAGTSTTITSYTKATTTVAGAGDGIAYVYINGELKATAACSSHAYSATVPTLVAGDEIKVVCKEDGHVSSAAEVTVAA